MDSMDLAGRIHRLRLDSQIGLRELSRKADMSPAALSAIEKGASSPTLATLHKILKALGTNFSDFFSQETNENQSPVYPAGSIPAIEDEQRRYTLLLPRGEQFRFNMVEEVLLPDEGDVEWEQHDFDLGGVVLSGGPGRLEIEGQGQWRLKKGDSYYIRSGHRHRVLNLSKRSMKQITVMDPPKY